MSLLWRWFKRLLLLALLTTIALATPVVYVETMCRGTTTPDSYTAILPPEHHRAEARTFMTYPEWHIVHAYDDYAKVITTKDPHDFNTFNSITGYWTSLCALTKTAASHGGIDTETKQLVYVIGTSFTAELALKAAYEETLGRLTTLLRGKTRTPLDDLSAQQATDYAKFLQQVPWYKWDFPAANDALNAAKTDALRDKERSLALGLENKAKAGYADIIAAAVASTGEDRLSLRMLVTGSATKDLKERDDVTITGLSSEGMEIETPRYRALTHLLDDMAQDQINFIEIAGNDDILFTAISSTPTDENALHSFARQGYGDYRHLIVVKVSDLAETLRTLPDAGLTLEHIHDY